MIKNVHWSACILVRFYILRRIERYMIKNVHWSACVLVRFYILRRIERYMIKNVHWSACILVRFYILRRIERYLIKNVHWSACILVRFEWNFDILDRFSKNNQISNFMKIHPVGAELFHADGWMDGRTDMTKLAVAFRNLANAPKKTISTASCRYLTSQSFSLGWSTGVPFGRLTVRLTGSYAGIQDSSPGTFFNRPFASCVDGSKSSAVLPLHRRLRHTRISEPILTCSQGSEQPTPQTPTPSL